MIWSDKKNWCKSNSGKRTPCPIKNMIEGKPFLDYNSLFSSNDYKKNGKITYKYFKDKYRKTNIKLDFRLQK